MAITAISRYFSLSPNLVGIIATDNLATITTQNYLVTQQPIINQINNGVFNWEDTDLVLIFYNGGINFFTRDAATNSFAPNGGNPDLLPVTIDDQGNMAGVNDLIMTGNLSISQSAAGTQIGGFVYNTSSAANSNSTFTSAVNGHNSPTYIWDQNGLQHWTAGIFGSLSGGDDNFHISQGNFSSNDAIILNGGPQTLTTFSGNGTVVAKNTPYLVTTYYNANVTTTTWTIAIGSMLSTDYVSVTPKSIQNAGAYYIDAQTTNGNLVINYASAPGEVRVDVIAYRG